MRNVPTSGGGCHRPDYVAAPKFATILGTDAPCSHHISVSSPSALLVGAEEDASVWTALASMPTRRTGARGVAFLLQHHTHAHSFRFIGEFVAHGAEGPLMQFLIIGGADIQFLPNIAHIANHQLLDALLMQRVDKAAGELVLDILDLML